MLGGEFLGQLRWDLTGGDRCLLGRQLLGGEGLLVLVQVLDLVAVLDGIGDELLDRVEIRVANGRQLDRRQVEVVLHPVLDAHRHQRIQPKFYQRHFPRKVLGLVTHCAADDRGQPVMHRLARVRRPLTQAAAHARPRGQGVVQDLGLIGGRHLDRISDLRAARDAGDHRSRKRRVRRCGPTDDRVVDQRERFVDAGVHLHRGPTGMPSECRHQPGPFAGNRPLLRGSQRSIRKHLDRGRLHQCSEVSRTLRRVFPDVPAVWHRDMRARNEPRPIR